MHAKLLCIGWIGEIWLVGWVFGWVGGVVGCVVGWVGGVWLDGWLCGSHLTGILSHKYPPLNSTHPNCPHFYKRPLFTGHHISEVF